MKQHKYKIITGVVILAVLAVAFWWGGDAPGMRGWQADTPQPAVSQSVPPADQAEPAEQPEPQQPAEPEERPGEDGALSAEEKVALAAQMAGAAVSAASQQPADEQPAASEAPEAEPPVQQTPPPAEPTAPAEPSEPQQPAESVQEKTCTLTVRCDTVLQNMSWLDPAKTGIIPADGVIFPEKTVTFYEGESVFNVLLREMKQNKIHFEYASTPIYNSVYLEGIGNLYEFDCGELSGWMYKVNDWFPNYGSSRYTVQEGDKIEVLYTCDLGVDIGGFYAAGQQK